MRLNSMKWKLLGGALSLLMLAGCSEEESALSEKTEPKQEQPQTEAAAEPEKEPKEKSEIPQAAIHNVEEIVKEKGRYVPGHTTAAQKEEILAEIEKAPEGLTGEQAYSIAVSLLAADIEEEARKFKAIDPVITIASETPEDGIVLPEEETVNVAILLDASGSMGGEVSGGQKMKLAKQAIQQYASDLPEGSNVMLRVYGHKGTGTDADKEMSCESNEVVYELGAYDEQQFGKSLEQFSPAGWTPLAGAIQAAQQDLQGQKGEHVQNAVYVVSDGIETCGGDPVAAAAALSESDIQAEVNIIGFDVDNEGQKQLEAVAKAGKGQYKSVYSESELNDFLKQEHSRLYLEWMAWSNDRTLEIMEQSNDINLELMTYNNDIYGKSLAAKNEMDFLFYQFKELEKFKGEDAEQRYKELLDIRHETIAQYFDQEKERKDTIRKEMKEQLQEKVNKMKEENQKVNGS